MQGKIILHIIGNNLKHLRSCSSLTQKELASIFNLSRSTYAAYENGAQLPSVLTLIRISNFYDITIDMLLDEKLNDTIGSSSY